MDKMRMESIDITAQNIEKIGVLFPNCITEMKDADGKLKKAINFKLLRQMLSGDVIEGDEAYEFTWVGKKAAIVEANKPIRKTLRPVMKDETVPTGADSEGSPYCSTAGANWNNTENLYIEGDNLEVLKLLQESYLGKVKMIYIDPPYNTGNDFIYRDDFKQTAADYDENSGVYDENGNRMFKNTDTNGRFHSDWCSMIYSRLMLARNLLAADGVIFISLDDGEVANLRNICDEVFGTENFIAQFIWKSRQNKDNRNINGVSIDHEYIISYSKSSGMRLFKGETRTGDGYSNPDNDPKGAWTSANMAGIATESQRPNLHYDLINPETGINYGRPKMGWRYDKNTMTRLIEEGRIIWPKDENGRPRRKAYLSELTGNAPGFTSLVGDSVYTRTGTLEIDSLFEQRIFNFPKPSSLIRQFIMQVCTTTGIVLDFFSGSASTAHAVMQFNAEDGGQRKFIMVQLAEKTDERSEAYQAGYSNICEIGKERIRRAAKKIAEEHPDAKFDGGFRVLKLDETNMKNVYYAPADYEQNVLDLLESNIKEDRTDLDLLFGCLLEWGLPLSLPYQSENIDGCTVHNYNDGDLIACFDENIPDSVIKTIAKRQPLRAVFRDSSFASSPAKINVTQIFKELAPDTSVKVL
mgnify:CR=1 FL=1